MCSDCSKWHFRGSSFQNFPGEDTPVPPYKTRVFGARSRTKHFWLATPLSTSHDSSEPTVNQGETIPIPTDMEMETFYNK